MTYHRGMATNETYTARRYDDDGNPTDDTLSFETLADLEAFLSIAPSWRRE